MPNPDIKAERAWTYQLSVERSSHSFLWGRCALYRSELRNAIDIYIDPVDSTKMEKNVAHRRRQGGEIEIRIALSGGFSASLSGAFCDVRELPSDMSFWSLSEGEVIRDRPRVTYDVRVGYEYGQGLGMTLRGHYIWWNGSEQSRPDDRKFIWDVKLFGKRGALKAFAAIHNLLDASCARMHVYPAPGRWFEGGVEYGL